MVSISKFLKRAWLAGMIIIITALVWPGCKPDSGAMGGLGPRVTPDFAMVNPAPGPNTIVLVNKTSRPSIPYWSIAYTAGSTQIKKKFNTDSASLYFPFAGTYALKVTLMVAANGGLDSVVKTVNVTIAQNDPAACQNSLQGFIASCSQKTWVLAPIGNAEVVGPSEGYATIWWGNGPAEPTGDRVCDFNDTYTFAFDAAGTFNYDNKGDFYADNYIGNSNSDCETNNVLPTAQKPWASGNFTYSVNPGGRAGLGQLTVNGTGAHIGIAKVQGDGTNDNTTAPSATAITYDILSMGHNSAGSYDSMILATPTSYGAWTYQLRSIP
jgi:hypothetical protein